MVPVLANPATALVGIASCEIGSLLVLRESEKVFDCDYSSVHSSTIGCQFSIVKGNIPECCKKCAGLAPYPLIARRPIVVAMVHECPYLREWVRVSGFKVLLRDSTELRGYLKHVTSPYRVSPVS